MEDNRNYDWYSPNSAGDWYAPNFETGAKETSPEPPPKVRRKHTGLLVTIVVLCVLILVAATALAFSGSFDLFGKAQAPSLSAPEGEDGSRQEQLRPEDLPEIFSEMFPGFGDMLPDFDGGEIIIPGDGGGQIIIPGDDGGQTTIPLPNDELPDDFRDFLDKYFTVEESIPASNIPRITPAGDFKLDLGSREGQERLSLQELYARCSPSVVGVIVNYEGKVGYGWGSGIILDKSGYIVTNAHVVSEADSCTVVLFNGKECPALLVGEDSQTDLAVLKIEAKGLVPAAFGDSEELAVGDDVAAIGNPLGMEFSGTITNGIVSAINRSVTYSGTRMPLIQTNAAINEGNSGGPLINMYGQVVGIVNMKMTNDYGVTIEGIGFAIPSAVVKKVADQIIENGKVVGRPGIGITCGSVPQQAIEEYGLPEGLYITEVSKGSDAENKGILPGDVLTHINGQKVIDTAEVLAIRDAHQVGDILRMTIYRNGETFEVDVEIGDLGNIY